MPVPYTFNDFFQTIVNRIPTENFFAFSLEATSFAGSPARLAVSNAGIECPVTFLAVSITSLTDNAFIMK